MTPKQPATAAGREFAKRIAHFHILGDIGSILAIEAEATAPTPDPASLTVTQGGIGRDSAQFAPTFAELPRTRGDGTVAYEPSDEPARLAAGYRGNAGVNQPLEYFYGRLAGARAGPRHPGYQLRAYNPE